MDFLDPKKRRAHRIRLYIGYALVSIALLLASTLLLFVTLGYGINSTTGEVTQNGLVFVDAHPQQAKIKINGQDKGQTDGRYILEAGNYDVELTRDGYRPWTRNFTLEGGKIVRLVYPFMFPQTLDSRSIVDFAGTPDMASSSPDRKWIVMHDISNPSQFKVVDTSEKELTQTSFNVPASILANVSNDSRFEEVEWSTDNRHLLMKHSYVGGYDFIVLDREKPTESLNLTQVFGKQYNIANLRDKKSDQMYLLDAATGNLVLGNTKSKEVTGVLEDVAAFWPYKEDQILYASTKNAAEGKALIKLKDAQITYTIKEVARSEKYLLNMAGFDGKNYLIAGSAADGKVYIYEDAIEDLKANSDKPLVQSVLLRVNGAQFVTFSGNARFISVQGGSNFAVYDFETEKQYRYDSELKIPATQKVKWMDGHRLMTVSDGKMYVFDYDGINKQELVAADAAFVPLFDRDYNQMFTISPNSSDVNKRTLLWTDINLGKE